MQLLAKCNLHHEYFGYVCIADYINPNWLLFYSIMKNGSLYSIHYVSFVGISYCLKEVLDIIERKLDKNQQQKLLQRLRINFDGRNLVFSQKLENSPWIEIKEQLGLMGRNDIVERIRQDTLITEGI